MRMDNQKIEGFRGRSLSIYKGGLRIVFFCVHKQSSYTEVSVAGSFFGGLQQVFKTYRIWMHLFLNGLTFISRDHIDSGLEYELFACMSSYDNETVIKK